MSCKEVKKMSSKSIEIKSINTDDCLDLLPIDVVGHMNVKTYHRKEYFISYVDTHSR